MQKKCSGPRSMSPLHLYATICKNMPKYARYVSMKFMCMICKNVHPTLLMGCCVYIYYIGLVSKFHYTLCLSVNTGTLEATVNNPNLTTLEYALTNTTNLFTNILPFTINYLNNTSANCGIPAITAVVVAGLYCQTTLNLMCQYQFSKHISHTSPCVYFFQIQ